MSAGKKVVQAAVSVAGCAVGIALYNQVAGAAALPVSASNATSPNHTKAMAATK